MDKRSVLAAWYAVIYGDSTLYVVVKLCPVGRYALYADFECTVKVHRFEVYLLAVAHPCAVPLLIKG